MRYPQETGPFSFFLLGKAAGLVIGRLRHVKGGAQFETPLPGQPVDDVATLYLALSELTASEHTNPDDVKIWATPGSVLIAPAADAVAVATAVAFLAMPVHAIRPWAFPFAIILLMVAYALVGLSGIANALDGFKIARNELLEPFSKTIEGYAKRAPYQSSFLEATRHSDRYLLTLGREMLSASRGFVERRQRIFQGELIEKVGAFPGALALFVPGLGDALHLKLPDWIQQNQSTLYIASAIWLAFVFSAQANNWLLASYDRVIGTIKATSERSTGYAEAEKT